MGEVLDSKKSSAEDPFSGFYLYEPGPEGLKRNRDAYPRMWGILLSQMVEIPDASDRRFRISKLYKLAHEYGFPAEEMNGYYEQALEGMDRERTITDEIEYATTGLTDEKVQVWPPDMDSVDRLHRVVVSIPEFGRTIRLTEYH